MLWLTPLLLWLFCIPLVAQTASPPVLASHGMVAAAEPLAAAAGLALMRRGGTAIDAAVAVGFALAVTWPPAGNLGGGGFMVLHTEAGRDVAVDFREMAPGKATSGMFLDQRGRPRPALSQRSLLGVGVPGSVAGLCHVARRYASRPLKELLAPAVRLARDGFPLSRRLAASLNAPPIRALLQRCPESQRIFLRPHGGWKPGDILRQPELAATLEGIARLGPAAFYQGATARLMQATMQAGGGLITLHDLAGYVVKERPPLRGRYRGWEIVAMPPPSSGGVALLQMLGVLEGFPVERLGLASERGLHILAESMRQAFHDRARYLGDPDFSSVPLKMLLGRERIRRFRAAIGELAGVSRTDISPPASREKEETTHFSVMDARGNAVACTYTLNGAYGCGVTVKGAGFLLNNEMDDFSSAPGQPNMYGLIQGPANAVGPGKRPLSSMTPTLLFRKGHVALAIGSPGGPTIINTVLQCILNVVDHKLSISGALAAPRIHHQWMPDRIDYEPFGLNPEVARGLRARGHLLHRRNPMGDAMGILWNPRLKRLEGAADPRGGGVAVGY